MTVIRIQLSYSKPDCLSILLDGPISHAYKANNRTV